MRRVVADDDHQHDDDDGDGGDDGADNRMRRAERSNRPEHTGRRQLPLSQHTVEYSVSVGVDVVDTILFPVWRCQRSTRFH